MAWEKIVRVVAVSACPKCGNGGFDLMPGEDIDDPKALLKCGRCGHVCSSDKAMRRVPPSDQTL